MTPTPFSYRALFLALAVLLLAAPAPRAAENPASFHQKALDLHKKGELQQAEALYKQAVAKDKNNAELHLDYGDLLMLQQRFSEAKDHYQAAIALSPKNATAHTNLGLVHEALGDLEKAKREHQQALTIDPNHPQAHLNLGHVFELLGMLEEAEAEYRKSVIVNVNYLLGYESLAQVLVKTGDYSASADVYQKALSIDPGSAAIHNNLAHAYYKMGDLEKAIQELEKTLELDPENEVIRKNLTYLLEKAKGEKVPPKVSEKARQVAAETLAAEAVSQQALEAAAAQPLAAPPQQPAEITPAPPPESHAAAESLPQEEPAEEEVVVLNPVTNAERARQRGAIRTGDLPRKPRQRDQQAGAAEEDELASAPASSGAAVAPASLGRTARSRPPSHGFTTQDMPLQTWKARVYPVQGGEGQAASFGLTEEMSQKLVAALAGLGILEVTYAQGAPNPSQDMDVDLVITPTLTRFGLSSGVSKKLMGLRESEAAIAEVSLDIAVVDRKNRQLHTRQNITGRQQKEGFLLFQEERSLLETAQQNAVAQAAAAVRSLVLSLTRE